jgi:hypothetical protein
MGGGRVATLGAIVGLCASSVGVGALCVVTGVLQLPLWAERPQPERPSHAAPPRRTAEKPAAPAVDLAAVRGTRAPAPPATGRRVKPESARDPSQKRTPTSHEHPPIVPVAAGAPAEFAPAPTRTGATPPAPPPATGGGEFTP